MANQLRVHIETTGILFATDVARLVLSLNDLHVAAALAGSRGQFVSDALEASGVLESARRAVDETGFTDEALIAAAAAICSVTIERQADALRVVELRTGSFEIVIEELMDDVFDRLRFLIDQLRAFLPRNDRNTAATALAVMKESPVHAGAVEAVVSVAALNARLALHNVNASALNVTNPLAQDVMARQSPPDKMH